MDLLAHESPPGDAAANLALEEALARAGPPRPALRVWQNDTCVVIGRGQRVSREADLAACAADAVPVLRRGSGGGAVFQDLGNLNVSVAAPGPAPWLAGALADLVARALAALGLAPTVGERGVRVGPAKVSGLASQVTRDGSVAHATLLVTTPARLVRAYLAPARADTRPCDSHRAPVAPLCELSPGLGVSECRAAVLAEAAARHGTLAPRALRAAERRWRDRLLADRYRDPRWHLTGAARPAAPGRGGAPLRAPDPSEQPTHQRTEEAPWTMRPAATCTG